MSTGHFFGVRYHRHLLKDSARTEGYRRGIEALVRPGDVVVDVGAGTGVLSIFAARAGARKVYALESTPIARLARQIVADNGLASVIEVIEADASAASLPEPADLLVSECMGNFVYSDAMLGVLARSRRLLKPEGRICPARIQTWLAPAGLAPLLGEFAWWEQPRYGIDFRAARASAVNDTYAIQCPAPQILAAEPALFGEIAPGEGVPAPRREVRWPLAQPGVIDSLVGWFTADLAPGVALDTGPGTFTHWGQVVFPLPEVIAEPGGELAVTLAVSVGEMELPTYAWEGVYRDAAGQERLRFSRGQDLRFRPWDAVEERF